MADDEDDDDLDDEDDEPEAQAEEDQEDAEEEENQMPDNGNRGNANRGGNNNRGGNRGNNRGGQGQGRDDSPDFASSDKFGTRFLSNILHIVVANWGEKAGDTAFVSGLMTALERLIGPAFMGGLTALLAAGVNNPAVVKGWLRVIGVPANVIALSDEAIDSFIQGVMHTHRAKGKLTESDLANIRLDSDKKPEEQATLGQGILRLTEADQGRFNVGYSELVATEKRATQLKAAFDARLKQELDQVRAHAQVHGQDADELVRRVRKNFLEHVVAQIEAGTVNTGFSPGDAKAIVQEKYRSERERFDALRGAIKGTRREINQLLKGMLAKPAHEWANFLESLTSGKKKESALVRASDAGSKLVGKVTGWFSRGVNSLLENPEEGMAEMATGIKEAREGFDRRTAEIEANNKTLGNKR